MFEAAARRPRDGPDFENLVDLRVDVAADELMCRIGNLANK